MSEAEIIASFNRLRQDQGTLMSRIAELEGERHDHGLVLDTLKALDGGRKCHRLVGGVLVERTVETVRPEVESSLHSIDATLKTFHEQLLRKEKELEQFMAQHKINVKGAGNAPPQQGNAPEEANRGVLA